MKLKQGYLIAIEGADGCGKSTSVRILKRMLSDKHVPAVYTKEPAFAESKVSQHVRDYLISHDLSKKLQAALFVIARREHLAKVIIPAMKAHKLVITDRYLMSSLAYQGEFQHGSDENHIMKFNLDNVPQLKNYLPDCNFYFHMPARKEIERLIGRVNKEDTFDKHLEKVHNLNILKRDYGYSIKELDRYNSPTVMLDAEKHDQFDRAEMMFKKIAQLLKW